MVTACGTKSVFGEGARTGKGNSADHRDPVYRGQGADP